MITAHLKNGPQRFGVIDGAAIHVGHRNMPVGWSGCIRKQRSQCCGLLAYESREFGEKPGLFIAFPIHLKFEPPSRPRIVKAKLQRRGMTGFVERKGDESLPPKELRVAKHSN